jgi:small conductance mechanosensitive channel
MENQFGVGDVVRLEGVSGAVERMTLRVVVLRDVHGVVHVVPNGEIKKVSNLTRGWARVVLDVAVAYKEDPDA